MTADPLTPLKPAPSSPAAAQQPPADESGRTRSALEAVGPGIAQEPISAAELWLRRVAILLFVIICALMGVLLVVLPWSLQWTDNRLLWGHPELHDLLANGFVRGLCSGLGILDLWIGFHEAVQYHEEQTAPK